MFRLLWSCNFGRSRGHDALHGIGSWWCCDFGHGACEVTGKMLRNELLTVTVEYDVNASPVAVIRSIPIWQRLPGYTF
jgi:hypothetical protein